MKTTLSLLALFVIILAGGYWWSTHPSQQAVQPAASAVGSASGNSAAATSTSGTGSGTGETQAPVPGAKPGSTSYTLAQVATHNTSASCWAAISGNVYNLTSWISQHPGGEARILSICGKDGTQAFMGQHGNDGQAQSILATFKIGTLAS